MKINFVLKIAFVVHKHEFKFWELGIKASSEF